MNIFSFPICLCFVFVALISTALCQYIAKKTFTALQLNLYRIKPFLAYVYNFKNVYFIKLLFLSLSSVAFATVITLFSIALNLKAEFTLFGIVPYVIFLLNFIHRENANATKSKVVKTKRFKRLFILQLLLNILLSYFLIAISYYFAPTLSFGIVCFHPLILPLILALSNLLLKPLEFLISNKYKAMAKKKLSGCDNLIKIAITGSYGKTSTKSILAHLLGDDYLVCASPYSYNTEMGITKVILNDLMPYHNVLLVEMGADRKNDIKKLCNIVKAQYGIVTAVGNSHLKTFKTKRNLIATKHQLVECVENENGFMAFNGDNEITKQFYDKAKCSKNLVSVTSFATEICILDYEFTTNGTSFTLLANGQKCECNTRLLGRHNLENILLATSLALKLGVTLKTIKSKIFTLEQVPHRLELKQKDNYFILDDAFNSNEIGFANALEVLSHCNGKKIVVTPGIVELAQKSEEINKKMGNLIAKTANVCIVVNLTNKKALEQGIDNKIKTFFAKDFFEAQEFLQKELEQNAVVLYENDLPDSYL